MTPLDHAADQPLAVRFQALMAAEPNLRRRDAATKLGASEAALIAAPLPGQDTTRLKTDWSALFSAFPTLGEVMCLTRNEHCVHEKTGPFERVEVGPHVGLVLGEQIDLRVFPSAWKFGFAVEQETERGPQRSLQFFDGAGGALFKLYAKPATNLDAWAALIENFKDADAGEPVFGALPAPAAAKPDSEIDVDGFRAAWDGMKDTHEFFGMLKKFGVERVQALRLAGLERARPVALDSIKTILQQSADSGQSIMVFVGNNGMIQIHTGPVHKLVEMGPWYNVLDPDFNLHLLTGGIDSAWAVRKPTSDGDVTSLELFDAKGGTIAMLFGARKPGKPEDTSWRALVTALPTVAN
ncbi:hemin-degrading factor [Lacibacterium aquatile]|uniref:Hemin-degrading factor n=1 Tax=Lacibacterium aquatile TaxID=1168082 RepID=A0ABW5DPU7_9PROT